MCHKCMRCEHPFKSKLHFNSWVKCPGERKWSSVYKSLWQGHSKKSGGSIAKIKPTFLRTERPGVCFLLLMPNPCLLQFLHREMFCMCTCHPIAKRMDPIRAESPLSKGVGCLIGTYALGIWGTISKTGLTFDGALCSTFTWFPPSHLRFCHIVYKYP